MTCAKRPNVWEPTCPMDGGCVKMLLAGAAFAHLPEVQQNCFARCRTHCSTSSKQAKHSTSFSRHPASCNCAPYSGKTLLPGRQYSGAHFSLRTANRRHACDRIRP